MTSVLVDHPAGMTEGLLWRPEMNVARVHRSWQGYVVIQMDNISTLLAGGPGVGLSIYHLPASRIQKFSLSSTSHRQPIHPEQVDGRGKNDGEPFISK